MYSTVDFRKLQDRLNNIVNEGSMKDTVIKIEDFIEKYSEYYGSNGDTLPQGYVQYALNSGIATDAIENDESEALSKKYGEMMDDNPWQFADEMPITKQMFDEIASITGTDDVEENGEMISGVLDSMEDVYVNEEPNEGNEFSGNRQDAIDKGEDEFEVDGKKYKVTKEAEEFTDTNRITDMEELNLYSEEDIENNSQLNAEELKDALQQDIYHLMDMASDDFTDNDYIADEMGDHFANMHLKADDATLSCYAAIRDLVDEDPADVYEAGKQCLKILGAQEHEDNIRGNKGPAGKAKESLGDLARLAGLSDVTEKDDAIDAIIKHGYTNDTLPDQYRQKSKPIPQPRMRPKADMPPIKTPRVPQVNVKRSNPLTPRQIKV